MELFDSFDQIGQYSNMELRRKLCKLKSNNLHCFLEMYLNKSYNLYKKKKNCDISFADYQEQLLKEIEKHKNHNNIKKIGQN